MLPPPSPFLQPWGSSRARSRGMSNAGPSTTTPSRRATAARLSWGAGALVLPADISQGVARTSLSVSSAKAIESCPARWAAEKLFPSQSLFDAATVGNGGHAVLERLFALPGAERTIDRAAELLGAVIDDFRDGTDSRYAFPELAEDATRTRWSADVWNGIATLWDIEDPTTVDVYANEYEVETVDVGGVPFGGFIDRIDRVTHSKTGVPALRLVDFKTGKFIDQDAKRRFGDDHGDQLRLYAEAIEAIFAALPETDPDHGLKVIEAVDYYTRHGKKTKVALSAPYRRRTLAAHAERWAKHGECTSSGRFPAQASALCTFCPLVLQCPFRAESVNWGRVKPQALKLSDAPILPPVSEYIPQAMSLSAEIDAAAAMPNPFEEFIGDYGDGPDEDEGTLPAPVGPLTVPEAMNPFLRIDEEVFEAELDPFAPSFPSAACTAGAAGDDRVPGAVGARWVPVHDEAQTARAHGPGWDADEDFGSIGWGDDEPEQ